MKLRAWTIRLAATAVAFCFICTLWEWWIDTVEGWTDLITIGVEG